MHLSQYDVVVVGAGAAGLTAAVGLARAGFAVAVVEAASFPGAENWSGCVYFAENLADPDILGPDGVEALAWERRLVERGFFATDGHGIFGATYRDADAFRHCYTVLRPIYDRHLGHIAVQHGVALHNATTAESLIRDGGRVVGLATNRGPLYADVVFLAEGDASHLVTREGYERSADPRDAPEFLLGIKQVIELPPGAVEERFGVGAEEGVAYEMLVRNGTLNGRPLHLNMGGFVYTNRTSLSVGLVLPAANLTRHFDGDPNLLTEWFLELPALRPWLRDGRRGAYGAKLIRGGGAKDVPTLVDDGLAIGGAASAIGVSFPYPNFTGPATRMGLLLVRAARAIRDGEEDFTRVALERHYLEPLRRTHYWMDVEFLRHWPEYVKRTSVLFGRDLDLVLGSAYVWTRPGRWFGRKLRQWLRFFNEEMTPWRWAGVRADARRLGHALRLREAIGRLAFWRMLLDGALNALRDFAGRPRAGVPPAGELRWHFRAGAWSGDHAPAPEPPRWLARWFRRFHAVLAAAARTVYRNDDTPLAEKLSAALDLLVRQINLLDVLAAAGLALVAGVANMVGAAWRGLRRRLFGTAPPRGSTVRGTAARRYADAALQARDLTAVVERAARALEDRLAVIEHQGGKHPHIHVLWPLSLAERNAVTEAGLWHVCPTRVFESHAGPQGQVRVVVNADNCIKCETCWRTSDLVDWGRDGELRFAYPVDSTAAARFRKGIDDAGPVRAVAPRQTDVWAQFVPVDSAPPEAGRLIGMLDATLTRFDASLAEGSPIIGRDRAEYLETLARHAQQVARRLAEVLNAAAASRPEKGWEVVLRLAVGLAGKAEERARRAWDRRFAWAAADGRQMRQHHLAGLRRLLGPLPVATPPMHRLSDDDAAALRIAHEICRRTLVDAATRVRFDGLFQDEDGRDAIGKFGAVKRLVATVAARRYLIETMAATPHETHAGFVAALIADCLGAMVRASGQVFEIDDSHDRLRRKPEQTWQALGTALLRDWRPDGSTLTMPDAPELLAELEQRQALLSEHHEIERLRRQAAEVVNDWQSRRDESTEVLENMARLEAYMYGASCLLLRTHTRMESGLDTEVEVGLLRVWLQETAAALDRLVNAVRIVLEPPGRTDERPLVDPGAPPAIASYAEFLAAFAPYDSGDFLCAPVNLYAPRAVPEMADVGSRNGKQEDEFLCAALTCDVAGRAEHRDTRSLRIESVAVRVVCGPAGRPGAAAFWRFLVLRDLTNDVAPRWAKVPPQPPQHLAREALELEALKGLFRRRFDAALALFGPALWQNPNLQANVFALPEAAAWLKAADSVLGRMAWLCRRGGTDDEPAPRDPAGARALARAFAEVRDRLRHFDDDLTLLRRGHYAPHVRAASLLLDRSR